jgi:hypothetical protein
MEAVGGRGHREGPECPRPIKIGSPAELRGANGSDLGVLGEGNRVFYVDPQIADHILDLAVTEAAERPTYSH